MARVKTFERVTKERQRVHDVVACGYSVFVADDGSRYLQLDTYGRPERKFVGDASQSLQVDRAAAARLKKLLEESFPGL